VKKSKKEVQGGENDPNVRVGRLPLRASWASPRPYYLRAERKKRRGEKEKKKQMMHVSNHRCLQIINTLLIPIFRKKKRKKKKGRREKGGEKEGKAAEVLGGRCTLVSFCPLRQGKGKRKGRGKKK